MSCGLCHEVCPFDAIKMDHAFELSTSDHPTMTVDKAGLDRPVSYYAALAPTMWAEVKDGAYKKLQGSVKRRSGAIGIAPQMVSKVQKAAPAAARPATGAAPAAAKPAAPVAAVGKNMSDEKLARLAAIRAANAGKGGGATAAAPVATDGPADVAEEVVEAVPVAPVRAARMSGNSIPFSGDNLLGGVPENTVMAEDKLERLKAIRSGNLAKRG